MKNNRLIKNIGFFGIFGVLFSCDVLDQEPQTQISDQGAFTNEKSADAALAGLYNQFQAGDYYGSNFQIIADVSSDVSQSVGTWDFYREMDTYELDASNLEATNFYTAAYKAVNQANNIIADVPNIEMDQTKKNNIIGQAYLLRGLAFFDLNRVFGGIPGGIAGELSVVLPLEPSRALGESLYPSRPGLVEGYSQIESDLLEALSLLPEEQSSSSLTRSRGVKATARALLARLYLYQRDYDKAIEYSSQVIADSKYSMVDDFVGIFTNSFTDESIFELEFIASDQSELRFWYFPGALGGRGELAVHEDFLNDIMTDPDDIRGTMYGYDPIQGVSYPTKYQTAGNTDNAHILRISEMYLVRAEAYAQSSSTLNEALADLNKVKNRVGVADYSGAMNSESILLDIERERKIEFAFEGHSFFDLVRTGRAMEVLKAVNRKNSSVPVSLDEAYMLVLPIPRDELLSNPNMIQNTGYGN